MAVTHRCRSCCLNAGRTFGGSHKSALCLYLHMCAGNLRFHSYKSLKKRADLNVTFFYESVRNYIVFNFCFLVKINTTDHTCVEFH